VSWRLVFSLDVPISSAHGILDMTYRSEMQSSTSSEDLHLLSLVSSHMVSCRCMALVA